MISFSPGVLTCTGEEAFDATIEVLKQHRDDLNTRARKDEAVIAALGAAIASMRYLKHYHPEIMKEEIPIEKL